MTRKRDYISEILEIRTRAHKRAHRWQQFTKRNEAIIDAIRFLEKGRGNHAERIELLKYISIGSVACVEAYFRMAVRDLIDRGSPFTENARRLQDMKLDIGTVLDMRREKVSHGELIAHLLPINGLDDINRHMSILTSVDFLDNVKNTHIKEFGAPAIELIPDLFERIKDLFARRHIFCHEIAMKLKPTLAVESRILSSTILFVGAADRVIDGVIARPPAPSNGGA